MPSERVNQAESVKEDDLTKDEAITLVESIPYYSS